jgi:general secretion pathway protein G
MRARGFTLIELVITLAVIGLLVSAALPLAGIDAYKLAADTGHIEKEIEKTGYPPDLKSLYAGVRDLTSVNNLNLYFLRRIPRDPFFPDGAVPAEETWGLRSYASPPDDPQPGDDVYDVHSLATDKGLNGVPYREW